MDINLRKFLGQKKRIVVKVGSSSLQHPETGKLNFLKVERLVRELCDLKNSGMDVCLVSSGAIAVGRTFMGMDKRPHTIARKQACAAVGQARLMMTYQKMFAEYHQMAGQVLMTKNTMIDNVSRKNAQNTFEELFRLGVIPIVNENDTISTYEMQFGDNDTLSAVVARLCGADLLIIFTDIEGLYSADHRRDPDAHLIPVVEHIDAHLRAIAGGPGTAGGTGGMSTKLTAAELCMDAGIPMLITKGDRAEVLYDIVEGHVTGTLFTNPKASGGNVPI